MLGEVRVIGYSLQAVPQGNAAPGPLAPRFLIQQPGEDVLSDGFETQL